MRFIAALLCSALAHAESPHDTDPAAYGTDLSLRPTEGIWWSSEQPGTGVAFNMDQQGRWFAAIYLYDTDGNPTFLTMQGESLTYPVLYPSPDVPWVIAASPLIHSQGGQCLGCPWQPAQTSYAGEDAEIRFHGRNSAVLWVGDWSLRLTPLTVSDRPYESARLPFNRHYLFSGRVEPGGLSHVAVVWLRAGWSMTGFSNARFVCVDCRAVGPDGEPDAEADADLKAALETMEIYCGPFPCHLTLGADHAHSVPMFVDKNRQFYSALDTRPAPANAPVNVMKFQLLDEGWRPAPHVLPW